MDLREGSGRSTTAVREDHRKTVLDGRTRSTVESGENNLAPRLCEAACRRLFPPELLPYYNRCKEPFL